MNSTYTTRELTEEEANLLNKELTELLEKHGAEIGVVASLQILKREEVKEEFITNGEEATKAE